MVDIILIIILVGMPILLSFYNRNSQAYISYLINGKGELPIPLTNMTRKKFIIGFIKTFLFGFLKHMLLHIIEFVLPFLILPFIYEMSQKIFNEWYLSGTTRILATLFGAFLVLIPSFILLKKSKIWMRIYYYLISFLINGLVAIAWWASL